MRIIDISQPYYPQMKVYPGDPPYKSYPVSCFQNGDMCEVSEIRMGTHCGTHIDAPLHMIAHGMPVNNIPLDLFYGSCRVLTVPASIITEKMLLEFNIQKGERLLFRTDPSCKYEGDGRFNPAAFSMCAAQHLKNRQIKLVGIDSPSIENMESSDGAIHRLFLEAGIAVLEGLRLMHADKEKYLLSAFPLLLVGENGSPCRAVLIDEEI